MTAITPSSQAMVRPTGHESPRERSRTVPATYRAAAIKPPTRNTGSNCQPKIKAVVVGASGIVRPSSCSTSVVAEFSARG